MKKNPVIRASNAGAQVRKTSLLGTVEPSPVPYQPAGAKDAPGGGGEPRVAAEAKRDATAGHDVAGWRAASDALAAAWRTGQRRCYCGCFHDAATLADREALKAVHTANRLRVKQAVEALKQGKHR